MAGVKVAVAISGGVDSAVAAALLLKEGYEVTAFTHYLWGNKLSDPDRNPDLHVIEPAREVARKLNIPHQVIDFSEDFQKEVINPFCQAYKQGKTPNPCVLCNKNIRFHKLLGHLCSLGFAFMATGHYVRITQENNLFKIRKSADTLKDQSYFLYTLGQDQLKNLVFPVGNYTKDQIRQIARDIGLPNAGREDSQDICFIAGDYRNFIKNRVRCKPGDIVDVSGKILGKHQGLACYTVGQRHGIGISSREPLYVVSLNAAENKVVLGPIKYLFSYGLLADDVTWVSGVAPRFPAEITARIRYRSKEAQATLSWENDYIKVTFREPQFAITPGQSVVFYEGDVLLGGGIIEKALDNHAVI